MYFCKEHYNEKNYQRCTSALPYFDFNNILDYEGEQLRTIHETKILNTYFEGESVYTAQ